MRKGYIVFTAQSDSAPPPDNVWSVPEAASHFVLMAFLSLNYSKVIHFSELSDATNICLVLSVYCHHDIDKREINAFKTNKCPENTA